MSTDPRPAKAAREASTDPVAWPPVPGRSPQASACEPYREWIEARDGLERRLSRKRAQRGEAERSRTDQKITRTQPRTLRRLPGVKWKSSMPGPPSTEEAKKNSELRHFVAVRFSTARPTSKGPRR